MNFVKYLTPNFPEVIDFQPARPDQVLTSGIDTGHIWARGYLANFVSRRAEARIGD